MLVRLPHLNVYHTCTRALHISVPVANRSTVDLGVTVQKDKDTTKTILVMHALKLADTVTATHNVGKQLARTVMEQPTQTICPSLVTLKPILIKCVAQQCGYEKYACKMCNLHVQPHRLYSVLRP